MRPLAKVGIVALGYVAAVAVAALVVYIYILTTDGPDRQTYAAMYDFGDSLLFLAVFGLAAIPATGAALYFLRPYPRFWALFSIASLAVAATSLISCVIYLWPVPYVQGAPAPVWSTVATLRILLAPLCALCFLVSALFAPTHRARLLLFVSAAAETIAFAIVAFTWVLRRH